MQGFGIDRTLSGQEWRSLLLAGCGVLVVGLGAGVLIGRLTAAPPDPPPASASILPDTGGLPDSNPTIGISAVDADPPVAPPSPPATPPSPPAPVAAPPAPAPVAPPPVQHAVLVPPPAAAPAQELRKPAHPVGAKQTAAKSKTVAKPAVAETPAPVAGLRWAVQLGAFQSSDHANLLVYTLARHGQPAHVRFANGLFYVQTPPYRSAATAKSAAEALAAREHLSTYLIKLPGEAG
jgi:cell division septation protein DedD